MMVFLLVIALCVTLYALLYVIAAAVVAGDRIEKLAKRRELRRAQRHMAKREARQ